MARSASAGTAVKGVSWITVRRERLVKATDQLAHHVVYDLFAMPIRCRRGVLRRRPPSLLSNSTETLLPHVFLAASATANGSAPSFCATTRSACPSTSPQARDRVVTADSARSGCDVPLLGKYVRDDPAGHDVLELTDDTTWQPLQ